MGMVLLMAKSIFMCILSQYFVRGNYRCSEMVSLCVKQNDLEVWNILIRPFQGDLGTFLCVTSSLLSPPVSLLSLMKEKRYTDVEVC